MRHMLHTKVDALWRLEDFVQPHDMWMTYALYARGRGWEGEGGRVRARAKMVVRVRVRMSVSVRVM